MSDIKDEVATPDIVCQHKYLKHLTSRIPSFQQDTPVLLLLGRDSGTVMKPLDYVDTKEPYAYHNTFAWAVIGSVCQDRNHQHKSLQTSIKCHPHFHAKPQFSHVPEFLDAFVETQDNELLDFSIEEMQFLLIFDEEVKTTKKGGLQMPLAILFSRDLLTHNRVRRNAQELDDTLKFMSYNIKIGYMSQAPVSDPPPEDGKAWWLPIFLVCHTEKGKIHFVFDSSAQYIEISLKPVFLHDPDRNNCPHGILSRFRKGDVIFMANIESMFDHFQVAPEHRDYLHFFRFQDNDPSKPLIKYCAIIHIFGNSPNQEVAHYGIRRIATMGVCAIA